MSRRNSKANLRTNTSEESGKIRFHFETGEKYRPYTCVDRINKIDAKKQSKDDPRLSNISKEVPRQNMQVFSINETSFEATANRSPTTSGDVVKIEQCESSPLILSSEETIFPGTFDTLASQEFLSNPNQISLPQQAGTDLSYSGMQIQYSMPQYQFEAASSSSDNTYASLAISTDASQLYSANADGLSLASAIGTPVSGYPYSFMSDGAESPTDSYLSSPADSDLTAYEPTFCKRQSPLIYQESPMLSDTYQTECYPSQYPNSMSSTGPEFASFYDDSVVSSFIQWTYDQKPQNSVSEQVDFARQVSFDARHSFADRFDLC